MKYICPECKAPIYSRKLKICSSCHAPLPKEFLLSKEEIEGLEKETRKIKERNRELKRDIPQSFRSHMLDRAIEASEDSIERLNKIDKKED